MVYGEFNIIRDFFNKKKKRRTDVLAGIGDDCALVEILDKKKLAITTDTLVSGIHFLKNISPEDLAYKILAINLSDLAAVGAEPSWLILSLTLTKINKNWLEKFSVTLFKKIKYYKMQLIGGNISKGPMSITCSAYGLVSDRNYLSRKKACNNDLICVTGTLGDSAAGLAILKSKFFIKNKKDRKWLVKRHLRPTPRLKEGIILRHLASSGIDISDGLVSDLKHILNLSELGAIIQLESLPISRILSKYAKKKEGFFWALSGGEDYELCFTLSKVNICLLKSIFFSLKMKYTCIGWVTKKFKGIRFFYKKKEVFLRFSGYDHFFKKN